jgi:hypothetical protein
LEGVLCHFAQDFVLGKLNFGIKWDFLHSQLLFECYEAILQKTKSISQYVFANLL